MARPDLRPMHALPLLESRRTALENCVFCPKLCRSACPVSNAEPKETLTPWGKMSMTYFAARGDVPMEPSFAAPAWACTGCYGCRESCDHTNDVTGTLYDARTELVGSKVAPRAAALAIAGFGAHEAATRADVRALGEGAAGVRSDSRTKLLIGCVYARKAKSEAKDAIRAAAGVSGSEVSLVEGCCGLPLLMAGDKEGFARKAASLAEETRGAEKIMVVDAGCAMTLRNHYASIGVRLDGEVELVVERAAHELVRLEGAPGNGGNVRYHDPCQLGRGLGIYEAPRAVLTRILGRAPDEFDTRREKATCSGAGGLLPLTMPEVAKTIARTRVDEHEHSGGGRIVTACASSLRALRKNNPSPVDDIVTWIARAVRA
jgi:dimethylglycine catabolism B